MKRITMAAASLAAALALGAGDLARAQPAKGAPAAFERVREKMSASPREAKLAGDPDRDFAGLLIAHLEDAIYLAKTQLEFGGDRQMRQLAQKILDERQKELDELKQWQARTREPRYQAQPNQPPPGSGPLDRQTQAAPAGPPRAPSTPVQTAQAPAAVPAARQAASLSVVSGRIEKVDAAAGKITIDHGPIPNLDMDSMTMVFRVADPAMVKQVKPGEKIRFTADRVNGQITVTRIQKGR